jgi:hypothetical protein
MAEPVVVARSDRMHGAVELVGPAGVGKSTVARVLRRRDPSLPQALTSWDLSPWLLAQHGLRELPALARASRESHVTMSPHSLRFRCMADLTRVIAMCTRLRQANARQSGIVLLDEGPVFLLTRVLAYEAEALRTPVLRQRWLHAVEQCAAAVDHVVWIDAPDDVLAHRIRTRAKPHQVKESTDDEIARFSASYRAAFIEVTALFAVHGRPRVTRLTALDPVPTIAERVALVLRDARGR